VPPHTTGRPDQPQPVRQNDDPALRDARVHSLFVSWELPYDNEVPITGITLTVGNLSFALPPDATSYNVTGLYAATQFPATVTMHNALGTSPLSLSSWLTTLPTTPSVPRQPECDPKGTTHDSLAIIINPPERDNGQIVESYQYKLVAGNISASALRLRRAAAANEEKTLVYASPGELVLDASIAADEKTLKIDVSNRTHGLRFPIEPSSEYVVTVRAYNALGWSAWSPPSVTCIARDVPVPPFNWIPVIAALGGLMVVAICIAFYCARSNLSKIIAPKLRRAEKREVLEDFVSSDMTPMEEKDPELVINPIFVHKMKQSRERERKKKVKKGGIGKSGGLARLGLKIEERVKVEVDERVKDMYAVDHYLERERGINDAAKLKTAAEREQAGKALLKGQKKAADKSSLTAAQAKNQGFADARLHAREANRAAHQVLAEADEEDDDDLEYGGGGGGIRNGNGKSNTAVL